MGGERGWHVQRPTGEGRARLVRGGTGGVMGRGDGPRGASKARDEMRDFPGGPVVKSPPANAGGISSISGPGLGRFPHSREQLSPSTAPTTEAPAAAATKSLQSCPTLCTLPKE